MGSSALSKMRGLTFVHHEHCQSAIGCLALLKQLQTEPEWACSFPAQTLDAVGGGWGGSKGRAKKEIKCWDLGIEVSLYLL